MFENKFPRWLYWGLLITFIAVNGYYLFLVFRYLQSTVVFKTHHKYHCRSVFLV